MTQITFIQLTIISLISYQPSSIHDISFSFLLSISTLFSSLIIELLMVMAVKSYILIEEMQGEQWVILLYFLPCESEAKVKEDIISALKPYAPLAHTDIQLTNRDDKYSAILKIPAAKGKIIEALKEVKVGETIANVKRYYHDYQLYVNRMPKDIPTKEINRYFSNFGPVLSVVLVPSLKNDDKYCHCFIKFEQSNSVDKVLLVRKLEITGREIRAFRTFRIGESESSDKRLEITVEPIPQSIEVYENQINQHFQALGELRERVRFEVHDKRTCKGILTFTSKDKAEQILIKFDPNSINKGTFKIELKFWNHVVQEGCKVFVPGLSRNFDQAKIRSVFEAYGEVTDLALAPSKTTTVWNATITYSKKSSANVLLVEYTYNEDVKKLFHGKPHIEFYLNAGDRKNYNNYMHRGKPNKNFTPVYLGSPNPAFGQPGQFFAPFPPTQSFAPGQNFVQGQNFAQGQSFAPGQNFAQGQNFAPGQSMMPPSFIPRPNFTNPSGK